MSCATMFYQRVKPNSYNFSFCMETNLTNLKTDDCFQTGTLRVRHKSATEALLSFIFPKWMF